MKKIIALFLLLAVFTTGCSYKITSSTSQRYMGESENWRADYKVDFSTTFPEKSGKIYAEKKTEDHLSITCKNDADHLVITKHVEISYKDIDGNTSTQTEDYDSPKKAKQFHLGGGSASISELGDYLEAQENIHKAIMIYSGPGYELRTNTSITAIIRINEESETIVLTPVTDTTPMENIKEQIEEIFTQMQFEKRYPEYADSDWESELLDDL